jgi:transposase
LASTRERVAQTGRASSIGRWLVARITFVGWNFLACDREQQYLMPPSLTDWLPEDHLAWFVLGVVEQLDLSALHAGYRTDGWGRAAHDPSMMLALLLYAYCLGERSSRRIERRCLDDVAYRVITANATPDHATIARFRVRHQDVLAGLFVQSLRLCQAAGLVRLGVVALDGTKIAAQASMNATRRRADLEAEVAGMLAEAEASDSAEDGAELHRSSAEQARVLRGGQAARRARLLQAKARLEAEDHAALAAHQGTIAERAAKELATGKRIRGRKPQPPRPDPDRRVNTSDPDSRVMPIKKGWLQGYNAQIVTTIDQIIVAAQVHTCTNDQPLLHPMLAAAQNALHNAGIAEPIGTLLADAGYCTDTNLAAASRTGPRLLMPPYNTRKDRDVADARDQMGNRAPKPRSAKERMEQQLATEAGLALYRLRSQTVEPTFGQLKEVRGCRRFQRRGRAAVDSEWKLICATHNLLKLWRHGRP